MKICGLDFTSAPRSAKRLWLAVFSLRGTTLRFEELRGLPGLTDFSAFLASEGPWVAGLDFPFGLPSQFLREMGWPGEWSGYIAHVRNLGAEEFYRQVREHFARFRRQRKRLTDKLASAQSPLKLDFVPVGRMFYHGATRLLDSPCSILPLRPTPDRRIVLETYPALVVENLLCKRASYKNDLPMKQTGEQRGNRLRIVDGLMSDLVRTRYGLKVILPRDLQVRLVDDGSGDSLDSVLCAIQAAWSWTRSDSGFGVPADADPAEGWIVDPSLPCRQIPRQVRETFAPRPARGAA